MTPSDHPNPETPATPDEVSTEIAVEQAHVDRVYDELAKAASRVALVEAEGLARGRTDRTGDVRDEEITGLFERDALMFSANRRRTTLETQYEGLVFGRLDLEHDVRGDGATEREVRYVGRLGVRDDEYEPLVIDWRAPAAAPFYRSTPVEPMGVLRRRVLRCKGADVIGIEDDLMVPEAPEDLVVVGDGALMAALTRTRGARMRDIVATIQRHQDEAIRAPARGVTEITGGPGTGKTVVALHRAAYLLYSDRRRFEAGGILVVGPSSAYTAYIERVLPSLGEETVTLRSLGDVVEGVTTARLDPPAAAAIKGSLRIRRVLARAARDVIPDAPTQLRAFVAGRAIRLEAGVLDRVRSQVLRSHQRNHAADAALQALAEAAWATHREGEPGRSSSSGSATTRTSRRSWLGGGAPLDAREVLLWLADPERVTRYGAGVLSRDEVERARRVDADRPGDRRLVRGRRRAGRRPRGPPRRRPGRRRARSAASTRSRSSTTWPATASPRSASGTTRRRAPRAATRWPRTPRASGCCAGGWRPRRSTPTCSSTRPRTSPRCSGGCSAAAAAGRRGRSSATPRRPRGRTPRRRGRPARRRSAASSARCSTWTPTTATPARSSTTRPR